MNIFVVISVARQINGEYVMIKTEGAFKKPSDAEEFLKKLKKTYQNADGTVKALQITTPQGSIEAICEAGAFEVSLQD